MLFLLEKLTIIEFSGACLAIIGSFFLSIENKNNRNYLGN
jgi:drug/metabolite transporter (DMT)-like permease